MGTFMGLKILVFLEKLGRRAEFSHLNNNFCDRVGEGREGRGGEAVFVYLFIFI